MYITEHPVDNCTSQNTLWTILLSLSTLISLHVLRIVHMFSAMSSEKRLQKKIFAGVGIVGRGRTQKFISSLLDAALQILPTFKNIIINYLKH